MLHLPLHGTIAAAGAGMVSLIEYGAEHDHLNPGTTWLMAASSAGLLILISAVVLVIDYPAHVQSQLRSFQIALWLGAAVCLGLGLLHPAAWVLALGLSLVLGAVWWFAFYVRSVSGWHELHHPDIA